MRCVRFCMQLFLAQNVTPSQIHTSNGVHMSSDNPDRSHVCNGNTASLRVSTISASVVQRWRADQDELDQILQQYMKEMKTNENERDNTHIKCYFVCPMFIHTVCVSNIFLTNDCAITLRNISYQCLVKFGSIILIFFSESSFAIVAT